VRLQRINKQLQATRRSLRRWRLFWTSLGLHFPLWNAISKPQKNVYEFCSQVYSVHIISLLCMSLKHILILSASTSFKRVESLVLIGRLLMMGWDRRLITAAVVHPRVICNASHGRMILTEANSKLVYQSALAVTRNISVASGRVGEGNENVVYPSPWDFKRCFTRRKILRHGTSGFTFHPKEGVLRIFIALKNPLPWSGSN
jgi:hypothetical protein